MKLDLLESVGAPVLTLLQNLNTIAQTPLSAASVIKAQAAWLTFGGDALAALPSLGAAELSALISFVTQKVQALMPAAAAPA
jgi:hypothetical protein